MSKWGIIEAGMSGLRAEQAGALMVSETHRGIDTKGNVKEDCRN